MGTALRHIGAVSIALLVQLLAVSGPSGATTPGANGPIYFLGDSSRGPVIKSVTLGGTRDRVGASSGYDIEVSPNGRWILMGAGEIYKLRVNDGRRVRLTDSEFGGSWPSWSPDGRKVVFSHNDPIDKGYANLYVMDADGSNRRQLTSEPGCEIEPSWSPDGTTIAFTRLPAYVVGYGIFCSGDPDIYSVSADGTDLQALRATAGTIEREPDWSPDGAYLTFECGQTTRPSAICIGTSSGSEPAELTPHNGSMSSPSWSPDGRFIAFVWTPETEEDIDSEIAVIHPDGTGFRQLTHNHRTDFSPDWGSR